MLSIIIPDRNGQPYLQKTIDDLLSKAKGDIEIIVVCDGTWPNPSLKNSSRVIVVHQGTHFDNPGMRAAINKGMSVANGEYVMKIDEHCMVDEGFDLKLIADYKEGDVVIPRRYRLMADEEPWRLEEYLIASDGQVVADDLHFKHIRPPVDYMYLAYPFERAFDKTAGLHGDKWDQRTKEKMDIPIDETMTMQGSCYFMSKAHWQNIIGELDEENYGTFTQEAQEIQFKTQKAGGKIMVNKKTWYAHMHKGKKGKGYGFSNEQYRKHMEGTEKGRQYCIKHWVFEERDLLKELLARFWPVPGWPDDWEARIEADKALDYSNSPEKKDWYANNNKI